MKSIYRGGSSPHPSLKITSIYRGGRESDLYFVHPEKNRDDATNYFL